MAEGGSQQEATTPGTERDGPAAPATGPAAWAARLPWWGSGLVGSALMVLLSAPQMLRMANRPAGNLSWYRTAGGDTLLGLIADQVHYLRLSEAFAGRAPHTDIRPFSARFLASWLARFTGAPPQVGLWIVNVALLAAGTFALAALAHRLTGRRDRTLVAVLLWAVSFPVLWYAGKGLVDPAAVGLIPVVLLAAHTRRIVAGIVVLILAIWAKESALSVLPAVIVLEALAAGVTRPVKGLRIGAWVLGAGAAYVAAQHLVGPAPIVYAPWLPSSPSVALDLFLANIGRVGGTVQFLATTGVALFGMWCWWTSRRRGAPLSEDPIGAALVVGACTAMALGLWSLVSALFDGRTAWAALPFGALLVAVYFDAERFGHLDRRRIVRLAALGFGVLAAIFVVAIGAHVAVRLVQPDPGPFFPTMQTRVAAPPDRATTWQRHSGRGDATVRLDAAEGQPLVLDVDGSAFVHLSVAGKELTPTQGVRLGSFYLESPVPETVEVRSEGSWTLVAKPLDSTLPWEVVPALRGDGPAVVFVPWGVRQSKDVAFESDDPDAKVSFVGQCRLGECGDLESLGQVPAGTEAIVIDSSAPWKLSPGHPTPADRAVTLPGTKAQQ